MGEGMGTQINKTLGAKSWGTQIGSFIPIYTSSLGSYQVLFLKQFHHLETEQVYGGKDFIRECLRIPIKNPHLSQASTSHLEPRPGTIDHFGLSPTLKLRSPNPLHSSSQMHLNPIAYVCDS